MLECDRILLWYGRAGGRKGDVEWIYLHSKVKAQHVCASQHWRQQWRCTSMGFQHIVHHQNSSFHHSALVAACAVACVPHLGVLEALGRELDLCGQDNAHPRNTSTGKVLHGARTKSCQEELDSLSVDKKIFYELTAKKWRCQDHGLASALSVHLTRLKLINAPIAYPELDSIFQMVPPVSPGVVFIALPMKLAPERRRVKKKLYCSC